MRVLLTCVKAGLATAGRQEGGAVGRRSGRGHVTVATATVTVTAIVTTERVEIVVQICDDIECKQLEK